MNRYLILVLTGLLAACSPIPDNPVEEYVEDEIRALTGFGVDLSDDDEVLPVPPKGD